jgi:hypothetical protein
MPALLAGIHVLKPFETKDVDGRDKLGHDDGALSPRAASMTGCRQAGFCSGAPIRRLHRGNGLAAVGPLRVEPCAGNQLKP